VEVNPVTTVVSGNYYANNTSEDCINGMGVGAALGAFGGLPGIAAGLIGGRNYREMFPGHQ